MTIQQALSQTFRKLRTEKLDTASLDAEVLLSWVLKKSKEYLFTYPEKKLTRRQIKKLKVLATRRRKTEPIAYLVNHKEFYGLDFYINKNVLIPRPETEMIIDEVVMSLRGGRRRRTTKQSRLLSSACNDSLAIADIGTGSGAIIISLARTLSPNTYHLTPITYYATDISSAALKVAKKNAITHGVKINFKRGNLFEPIKNKAIDILTANLPYLTEQEISSAKNSSLAYEPKGALAGGKDGLQLYEELFKQVTADQNQPKLIIVEIGHRQAQAAKKLALKYFPAGQIEIKKDLADRNRILIIKKRFTNLL